MISTTLAIGIINGNLPALALRDFSFASDLDRCGYHIDYVDSTHNTKSIKCNY